ncbi:MAG TPA: carboxypeptidase-like regulatory domain-containing protein, partial [Ferruginibacter sp.]|nr:carboxypeptidase-like regulatory domain-containing protein [Ferruginibacter sp.]
MNKLLTFVTLFFLIPVTLLAQNKTIRGKAVDESGNPLAGISVLLSGAKTGTQTDKDGNFSISIPNNKNDLLFSSVGYKPELVDVAGKENITVIMQKEVTSAEEVVVVGYQTVKRKDLTGSVSSVNSKQIKDIPVN